MRTSIDKAGRLVIPKELRDRVGMVEGPVDVLVDGVGIRIEPVVADDTLEERDGKLFVPAGGAALTDEMVRALIDADRR